MPLILNAPTLSVQTSSTEGAEGPSEFDVDGDVTHDHDGDIGVDIDIDDTETGTEHHPDGMDPEHSASESIGGSEESGESADSIDYIFTQHDENVEVTVADHITENVIIAIIICIVCVCCLCAGVIVIGMCLFWRSSRNKAKRSVDMATDVVASKKALKSLHQKRGSKTNTKSYSHDLDVLVAANEGRVRTGGDPEGNTEDDEESETTGDEETESERDDEDQSLEDMYKSYTIPGVDHALTPCPAFNDDAFERSRERDGDHLGTVEASVVPLD